MSGADVISTDVCIVGGGPAGMMAGLLLAKQGVDVHVLEKHPDFLRDFRGDTIHPSTLQVIDELGWLDELLALPHQKVRRLHGEVGKAVLTIADFGSLKDAPPYLVLMPQWDFLQFLADKAKAYPSFHLHMNTQATDLLEGEDAIYGVLADGPGGERRFRASLTLVADGRDSRLRDLAGLIVQDQGAPMDVLWMKLPHNDGDPKEPLGIFRGGKIMIMIYRGDYWQCGFVIPKGGLNRLKARGLEALKSEMRQSVPFLREALETLQSWHEIKLLTVKVDRLETWHRPGLLCIGDAAHAMSPIGGVGINLAIQDAIATANILGPALRAGECLHYKLGAIQARRELPARLTQSAQILIQNRVIREILKGESPYSLPRPLLWAERVHVLPKLAARLVGLGIRPEHVSVN